MVVLEIYYLKNGGSGDGNILDDDGKFAIVDKNTDAFAEKIIIQAVLENETIIEALIEVVEVENEIF